ncbi:sugar O-acetyltransferase [Avibacterium paragallinarum]|uniref:Acetyltransferase n=1 Tax=Avibacterium paragallinarum TaxID=728 RepID=A0AAE5WHR3_AVIPA|nr:sugar O-acetyltransferase [Avibacterium paragallinarum]MEE3607520.1 sugar O-acetyltransferase [Avibacterium paragallinarum]MEE3620104.1 sugar O-acetyltransferase [Avibacterium paragallinarum]MEE3667788.1 sugar O-acetyltransferase [Avibacterium paragallinarum]MEE3680016.1 sugar O-acetyltransferase [Avibacterium paragallinarum]MEE4386451.1 sugar O-acetyltransferase [Avibacterium paragallinarum]
MLSNKQKMLAGFAHKPNDRELAQLRLENKKRLFQYNTQICPSEIEKRTALIQQILGKSKGIPHINAPFFCDYGCFIEVGENFFANYHCTLLDSGGIKIGDNVMFAPNVSLYTVGHPLDPELRQQDWEQALPIIIGNNVWIGGNTVILGGVTIGDNSVIGAGSLVNKNIPANSLAMGSPAKVIRQINEQDRINYMNKYMTDYV